MFGALRTTALPSKGEINRCGEYLTWAVFDSANPRFCWDPCRLERAYEVVAQFRSAHSYPLTKVVNGLRSMVRTEGCDIVVSQRLKRLPRIAKKLHRMSGTSLARLEDIAGCRAVLADGPELARVRQRLQRRWASGVVRVRDYIEQPKHIGYRAVHLVVERDGRRIEVQLRTRGQQQWAEAIEAIDARRGLHMKDGEGPADLVRYFSLAGSVIYAREYGLELGQALVDEFAVARDAVVRAGYYRQ